MAEQNRALRNETWTVVRVCVVAVLFQGTIFGFAFYCTPLWIAGWSERYDVSIAAALSIITALGLASAVISPMVGHALTRIPINLAVCIGGFMVVIGMVAVSHATTLLQVMSVYMLLMAAGSTLAGPISAQTLVVMSGSERLRGIALGIVSMGPACGGLVLPPLCAALIEHYGTEASLRILASGFALFVIPVCWFLARGQGGHKEHLRMPAAPTSSKDHRAHTSLSFYRDSEYRYVAIFLLAPTAVMTALQHNMGVLSQDVGLAPQTTALLLSTIAGAMMGAKFVVGLVLDRMSTKLLCLIVLAISSASVLLTLLPMGRVLLQTVCALAGIGSGATIPIVGILLSRRFGASNFSKAIGSIMPVMALATVAPMISGWLYDVTGSFHLAFVVFAPLLAAGIFSSLLMSDARPAACAGLNRSVGVRAVEEDGE